MYVHFTDAQKEQSKNVDLVALLNREGETLKRSGSEWEWFHDGAKITIRGNKWFHQYDHVGGTAIDFVRRFFNKDYPEAMLMLLGLSEGTLFHDDAPKKQKLPFALPNANKDMRRVFAYLMKARCIDREVLSIFAHKKLIYESKKHHNAVFVGFDENGVARHAHKRGTYSSSSYKGNINSSDPRFSFHYIGTGNTLYVFEAPIDMLSYISLHQDHWQGNSYVSLCCVSEIAALYQLEQHPNLKKVYLCLDHDKAGIEACYRIAERLREKGYADIVFDQPDRQKDWNETLKAENGLETLPAKDLPNIGEMKKLCRSLVSDSRYERMPPDLIGELMEEAGQFQRRPQDMEFVVDHCYDMALHTFLCAKDRYRQLQIQQTDEQLGNRLFSFYRPHKESLSLQGKLRNLFDSICTLKQQEAETGILTRTQMEQRIDRVLRVCMDSLCVYSAAEQQMQMKSSLEMTM